jgi:hypothetical protein
MKLNRRSTFSVFKGSQLEIKIDEAENTCPASSKTSSTSITSTISTPSTPSTTPKTSTTSMPSKNQTTSQTLTAPTILTADQVSNEKSIPWRAILTRFSVVFSHNFFFKDEIFLHLKLLNYFSDL